MKALILAAGYATRLYPLTINTPKALLKIDGKPIIDFIVEQINKIDDVSEIIIITNHKFYRLFEEWMLKSSSIKPITVIDDRTTSESDRLGAIGDIVYTIRDRKIDDEMLIIASDNFFTYDLKDCYNYFKSKNADCVCAKNIESNESLSRYGIAVLDNESKITNIEEKPEKPKSNTVVYATYFYTKNTVKMFEDYYIHSNKNDSPGCFLEWLYKISPVYAYLFDGECYDIGTPESYEQVCNSFQHS